ncbi:Aminoacyl-histidine dipeptidase, partial [human gut metagenome]
KNDTIAYNLVIRGLKGGHSGMEIHLGRGNSNRLMGRLLKNIDKELDFNLVSLNGGSKNNAIPRESSSIITISQKDERKLLDIKRRV